MQENEPRFIVETGMEARIAALVEPVLEDALYRLIRVRITGQNGCTLQIMAERHDGTMTIEDCENIHNLLSALLDVENVIEHAYHLEISSPGIDRPLVRKSDFKNWGKHLMRIELSNPLDNKRRFKGFVKSWTEDGFFFQPEEKSSQQTKRLNKKKTDLQDTPSLLQSEGENSKNESEEVYIAYDNIAQAHLILTDALIQEALRKDKKLRAQKKD